MLIEFSVSNFRSIRERQTLSMVAAARLRKRENIFIPDVLGEKIPALLKVVAIYGPNASGKSNLIKAFEVFERVVSSRPTSDKQEFPVDAFRFDAELANKPSDFEVHFIIHRQRYSFELSLTRDRVHKERLTAFPKGKSQLLYSRVHSGVGDVYEFGGALEGGSALHEVWKSLTSAKSLFLTQAVLNSNEELKQLRLPWQWLAKSAMNVSDSMRFLMKPAQALMAEMPEFGKMISEWLSSIDVPIDGIQSKRLRGSDEGGDSNAESETSGKGGFKYNPKDSFETTLTHVTSLGSAEFELKDESDGTRSLIGFALPWFLMEMDKSSQPKLLMMVDEMDSSLHPKIVEVLVSKFLSSKLHRQLIFTTHDTHLMDSKLLRRDQFWITERDGNGATQLRSIHDFEGREGEDIEKRYYEGRYRGLPIVHQG